MAKIVAAEYVSLDGVMQNPQWTGAYFEDELAQYQRAQLFASDALLLGRTTFQEFAGAWPHLEEREGDFAVRMNTMPKFVASRELAGALPWNGTLIEGEVPDAVAALKQRSGRDILIYGSGQLVRTLVDHGLIDRYRLMLFPIVLGRGDRLFGTSPSRELMLTDTRTTRTGVVMLTYDRPDVDATERV